MPTTTIHMTSDERAALDAAAEAAGLGPSSYARRAVMQSVGREANLRRRPDGLAQAFGRALGDLGCQSALNFDPLSASNIDPLV